MAGKKQTNFNFYYQKYSNLLQGKITQFNTELFTWVTNIKAHAPRLNPFLNQYLQNQIRT